MVPIVYIVTFLIAVTEKLTEQFKDERFVWFVVAKGSVHGFVAMDWEVLHGRRSLWHWRFFASGWPGSRENRGWEKCINFKATPLVTYFLQLDSIS
jgi:hypothetical protein